MSLAVGAAGVTHGLGGAGLTVSGARGEHDHGRQDRDGEQRASASGSAAP